MKIAFRADASREIGSGHVMRCLTLADELHAGGATVRFLCRPHAGHAGDLVLARGHALAMLSLASGPHASADGDIAHAAWLGCTWQEDCEQTAMELAAMGGADWLVVDHYALDARWEAPLRRNAARILVVDDLADRPHDCDLLLDQNQQAPGRYDAYLPAACIRLIGPRHALLRPSFRATRGRLPDRDGSVRRILVSFGASDASDETGKALRALAWSRANGLAIDVVIGVSNPHREELTRLCGALPDCHLHVQVEDMAPFMADAGLALGATGVTTWERASLGLPTLAVSVAANQLEIARAAEESGILTWLGEAASVTVEDWVLALDRALDSPMTLQAQSVAGLALVDGAGTRRVAEAMQ